MAKKKFKATLPNIVITKLKEAHDELEKRGAKDIDVSEILQALIQSDRGQEVIDQFVSDKTPDVYKAIQLLNTPGEGDKIRESFRDKHFGLNVKGSAHADGNTAQL